MAEAFRNALQAGHSRLYHYEGFRPEWLAATLRDQKLYCSDPASLNDPWDCRPTYDPASIQEPEEIEEFIQWLRKIAKQRPEARIEAIFEHRLRTDVTYRSQFVQEFSTSNRSMIDKRRIYCLTPNPCSTLMWSHYGDGHRGICLEFHVGNQVFLNAWELKYSATYPKWVPHRAFEFAQAMILTKSDEWEYENEFRVLASPDYPDGHPLKSVGDFLTLPPKALIGIIVGCKCDHEKVSEIVNQYSPGLPTRRVVQVPNHYRLTIDGRSQTAVA